MNPDETTPERPTNLADLLAELVPPSEPEPISLLPQTIGWPILAILLTALGIFVVLRVQRHRRAEAYRKVALRELNAAGLDPAAVTRVLRQTALTAYPRTKVAGLFGPDWLAFLEATCPGTAFHTPAGEALITAPYVAQTNLSAESLDLARHWVAHHQRTGPA